MIFWILLGIAVAVPVVAFFYAKFESGWWSEAFVFSGWAVLFSAFGLAGATLILWIVVSFMPNTTSDTRYGLTALGTNERTGWSFFLIAGGSTDETKFQYARDDHGAISILEIEVYRATIFEDNGQYMIEKSQRSGYWWAFPGAVSTPRTSTVEFHVPEGSVERGYDIKVGD